MHKILVLRTSLKPEAKGDEADSKKGRIQSEPTRIDTVAILVRIVPRWHLIYIASLYAFNSAFESNKFVIVFGNNPNLDTR